MKTNIATDNFMMNFKLGINKANGLSNDKELFETTEGFFEG